MACKISYAFDISTGQKTVTFTSETGEKYAVFHNLTWTVYGKSLLDITVESSVVNNILVTAELFTTGIVPLKRTAVLKNNRAVLNFKNIDYLTPDPWYCIIDMVPHLYLHEMQDSSSAYNSLAHLRKGPFTKSKLDQLSMDFLRLFTSGEMADVILTDGSNNIPAHKMVLSARSPVFARMFQNPMEENSENPVAIPDVPGEVLRELLTFIYSGSITIKDEIMARSLYIAAEKYAVMDLKNACSEVLKNVSFDNVLDTLSLAGLYEDNTLKSSCFAFISDNYNRVKISEAWALFIQENPVLAVDVSSFLEKKS